MEEAVQSLRVLEIFQASKDAKINNVKVKKISLLLWKTTNY